jgi:hypothetical protein
MIFQDADLFFFPPEDPRYDAGLAAYLERYNVAYVVMSYPHVPVIERRSDLLAPAGIQGGICTGSIACGDPPGTSRPGAVRSRPGSIASPCGAHAGAGDPGADPALSSHG